MQKQNKMGKSVSKAGFLVLKHPGDYGVSKGKETHTARNTTLT